MCDFHLSLLDLNFFIFAKKTLIGFWWFFEKYIYIYIFFFFWGELTELT